MRKDTQRLLDRQDGSERLTRGERGLEALRNICEAALEDVAGNPRLRRWLELKITELDKALGIVR